jgi:hypothetical protein
MDKGGLFSKAKAKAMLVSTMLFSHATHALSICRPRCPCLALAFEA